MGGHGFSRAQPDLGFSGFNRCGQAFPALIAQSPIPFFTSPGHFL